MIYEIKENEKIKISEEAYEKILARLFLVNAIICNNEAQGQIIDIFNEHFKIVKESPNPTISEETAKKIYSAYPVQTNKGITIKELQKKIKEQDLPKFRQAYRYYLTREDTARDNYKYAQRLKTFINNWARHYEEGVTAGEIKEGTEE